MYGKGSQDVPLDVFAQPDFWRDWSMERQRVWSPGWLAAAASKDSIGESRMGPWQMGRAAKNEIIDLAGPTSRGIGRASDTFSFTSIGVNAALGWRAESRGDFRAADAYMRQAGFDTATVAVEKGLEKLVGPLSAAGLGLADAGPPGWMIGAVVTAVAYSIQLSGPLERWYAAHGQHEAWGPGRAPRWVGGDGRQPPASLYIEPLKQDLRNIAELLGADATFMRAHGYRLRRGIGRSGPRWVGGDGKQPPSELGGLLHWLLRHTTTQVPGMSSPKVSCHRRAETPSAATLLAYHGASLHHPSSRRSRPAIYDLRCLPAHATPLQISCHRRGGAATESARGLTVLPTPGRPGRGGQSDLQARPLGVATGNPLNELKNWVVRTQTEESPPAPLPSHEMVVRRALPTRSTYASSQRAVTIVAPGRVGGERRPAVRATSKRRRPASQHHPAHGREQALAFARANGALPPPPAPAGVWQGTSTSGVPTRTGGDSSAAAHSQKSIYEDRNNATPGAGR